MKSKADHWGLSGIEVLAEQKARAQAKQEPNTKSTSRKLMRPQWKGSGRHCDREQEEKTGMRKM
jgi:hypothetical protein